MDRNAPRGMPSAAPLPSGAAVRNAELTGPREDGEGRAIPGIVTRMNLAVAAAAACTLNCPPGAVWGGTMTDSQHHLSGAGSGESPALPWLPSLHSSAAHPTWTGDVRALGALADARLGNSRDVWVYLPRSYGVGSRRYPVIYFHDGQNVFDATTSFAGVEWGADETLEVLARTGAGRESIAVAVANTRHRIDEYTPVMDVRGGGRASQYVDFLVQQLKPRIDGMFRTLPGREHTAVIGSSLGGLVSLYAGIAAPQVFGLVGALSPVFDWAGYDIEWRYGNAPATDLPLRLWVDMGAAEDAFPGAPAGPSRLVGDLRRFRMAIERRGFELGRNLGYEETAGARHDETAWAERLPRVLRFLLPTAGTDA